MKKLLEIEDKLNEALFVNERIKCEKWCTIHFTDIDFNLMHNF